MGDTAIQRPDACLFCGATDDLTEEHVFPAWLQREQDMANDSLTLLNGTTVRYPQLLVPACQTCNNVHGSQLEENVKDDAASDHEMWIWLLKLHLGTIYWESGRPLERDRRSELSKLSIVPNEGLDLDFFRRVFSAYKVDGQFGPKPLGTVLMFEANDIPYHYEDRLYTHPSHREIGHSASCMVLHERCWITIHDDGGAVGRGLDIGKMRELVRHGRDPRSFFPELLYVRSCTPWVPTTMTVEGPEGTQGVVVVPSMSPPPEIERTDEDFRAFMAEDARIRRG